MFTMQQARVLNLSCLLHIASACQSSFPGRLSLISITPVGHETRQSELSKHQQHHVAPSFNSSPKIHRTVPFVADWFCSRTGYAGLEINHPMISAFCFNCFANPSAQ